jgi:hypothetical protein
MPGSRRADEQERACPGKFPMNLSLESVLVYVMRHSGCVGRLSAGRVERHGAHLKVFGADGEPLHYISGEKLRSWCIYGRHGAPISGWSAVDPEDFAFLATMPG